MADTRNTRAKKNIVVSLLCQFVTLICGFIVPRLLLEAFGSETYGATSSIAQFLAYITLLEGGIGGVARAVLYKPLAENDRKTISAIMAEVRRFFRGIAFIFAGYVLILACGFKELSGLESLDWITTFVLVIVISISTFGQYFIGISNAVLLQAAQRVYVTNVVNIVTTLINAVGVVILTAMDCHIITVKLVSSVIFFMRPVALWLYVRRLYRLQPVAKQGKIYLTQKWSGLGQHLAFFLHSNTDVVVLTCLADLRAVAVYSVYNMIVSNMQNLAVSFVSGMEALFGDMLAREEYDRLHQTFGCYETIISAASIVLFATAAVLIVPFVRLYTAGITDSNYYEPVFAVLLILAALLYCLRMPYHSLIIAAGHFRQTSAAAYSEAAINILLSVVLVTDFGLPGVALGTLVATGFRFVYYVWYLSKHIFNRNMAMFWKRLSINAFGFGMIFALGSMVVSCFDIDNYLIWAACGFIVAGIASVTMLAFIVLFYRNDCRMLLSKFKGKQ